MREKTCKYSVIEGYRTDLYFNDYKLAIQIDENRHSDINTDFEIKRQKSIEQGLGCKFIRVNADKDDFDMFETIK